jgi:FMN phosphatase YigB (HAD superfamily)
MNTIVWDVDDVLNDLTGVWLREQWRPAHPACLVTYSDLCCNPPHSVIGARLEEYLQSLDDFRLRRYLPDLAPLPEALAWFELHGHRYRHIALTSVPLQYAPISAGWVVRHFGRWIRSFNFVPSGRTGESIPVYDGSKQEFLSWWGNASVMVDDHPGNVESARNAGVRAVLMPRPWNNGTGAIEETFEKLECL